MTEGFTWWPLVFVYICVRVCMCVCGQEGDCRILLVQT